MAGECAKGCIIGSASFAPLDTARRVEYASNVAALCSAMESTSQAFRGRVSVRITFADLPGARLGTRMVSSAWPFWEELSSFARVNGDGMALPLDESVDVELSKAAVASGRAVLVSAEASFTTGRAAMSGNGCTVGAKWRHSAAIARNMEGGSFVRTQ